MREEIANLVYPVLSYGVRLKESLAQHRPIKEFALAQKELLGLLQAPAPRAVATEMEGDGNAADSLRGMATSPRLHAFLGIRYALACWLDEIFITDSAWRSEWNENKIETALYRTNLRASIFWDQAHRAQSRPTKDALEVYYLCVMLGFRGELFGQPDKLAQWREAAESQIAQGDDRTWEPPPDQKIRPNVPLLVGAKRKQKMLLIVTLTLLLCIPPAVFWIVYNLR